MECYIDEFVVSDNYFIINFKLPSMNEYVGACRASAFVGAGFKKNVEKTINIGIEEGLKNQTLKPTDKEVDIVIYWVCKNKKRDVDNIQSSVKFILDSMVGNGILPNDSQKYIKQVFHKIGYGDKDYCMVMIFNHGDVELIKKEDE